MSYLDRAIADSANREQWEAERTGKIGASDAAKFSKYESAPLYAKAKLDSSFTGNAYTEHGNAREQKMLAPFRVPHNTLLFRSEGNPRHVATPDGIRQMQDGRLLLAEVKTTKKPWKTIPLSYYRQVWWAQYVLGATRTLFVWEEHDGFIPTSIDPRSIFIDRDDTEIDKLIRIADKVLSILDDANDFMKVLENV